MNKKTLLLFIICTVMLTTLSISCFAAPPSDDYQLILADEFEGTELNRDIWDYRSGNPYGGKNLKENVRVEDGMLYLDYRKVDSTYTGGGVLTPFTLPYGYYEVKAKVYNGANGLHTSFWTSGASAFSTLPALFPSNNCFIEIDIFEIDSREDDKFPNIHHGVHNWCGEHTSPFGARYDEIDASADFFVMGMEWLPDRLNYYINGELISTYDDLSIYGPSFLWLTAVAMPEKYDNGDGTFNIDDSKADANGYFGSSVFEYFRYYQKPLKGVNLLGNHNFEYNKVNNSPLPSTFALTGDTSASFVQKSPLAYDGFCYHTHQSINPYSLATGQQFHSLVPGKYTFKGQFKATSGLATARMVVYDKEGNILGEKAIPEADDWTEVSITDIPVDGYAYVAVESSSEGGNTMLSMDALEFYIQDGEEYTSFNTPLYEGAIGGNPVKTTTYTLDNATSSTGTWTSSGLESDTYYLTGTLRDVEVNWEITASETDTYRLELYNLIHENNTASQNYYITMPDGTVDTVPVDTKTGESSWITLGTYALNQGEVLKVSMKSKNQSGHVRISKLRTYKNSDYLAYYSSVVQLDSYVFSHLNTPYVYDKEDLELVAYESNGTYYIPYQKLKEITGYTADIAETSEYVTTAQLEAAGIGVTIKYPNIFLHKKGENYNDAAIEKALDYFLYFVEPFFPVHATFVGTDAVSGQVVKDGDDAEYFGTSWLTSGNVIDHKYTGDQSCYAQWTIEAPSTGEFSIDIFSPSHSSNGTDRADISVYVNGNRNVYVLNQKNTAGWYNIGSESLKEGDEIRIAMRLKGTGFMRVGKVRISPLQNPVFVNDIDELNQELYSHTVATKTGIWQNSTGVYTGCCTAPPTEENKDASITWEVSPSKNYEYSIQVHVPKYTSSGANCAEITLTVDGTTTYFMVNQRADSEENTGSGWYDLGSFNLTTESTVTVSIKNKTMEGWLRAKAIRLVPAAGAPAFANNKDVLFKEYFGHDKAEKIGTWSAADEGCISSSDSNASVKWTVSPENDKTYDLQVYIPKSASDATSSALILLEHDNKLSRFVLSQQPDSEEDTGSGWYSLGSYDLTTADTLSVSISNKAESGNLYAKALRLVPAVEPGFVGNFNETNQELHTFTSATKTGNWIKSGSSSNLAGCYYGDYDSTVSWTVTPNSSQKYSIQVYIPTYIVNASSTTDGYVTLTIDGVSHTFNGINQQKDPELWQGWYDLGVFDLTTNSTVSVTIGKNSGTFIRAKDLRLVPYPNAVPVTKSGDVVKVTAGTVSNHAKNIIFVEYGSDGRQESVQILESAPILNITMQNSANKYKLFFWKNISSMVPIIPIIESN